MKKVRFAIVGTGSIADFHAQAIHEVEGAELTAVYSQGGPKAQAFAETHNALACSSLEELLARRDVDAVCITSPSGAHAEASIAAMNAGKHVLCEKPFDVTLERIDAMIEASRQTGRILAAVFQSRFGQGAKTLKAAIDAGRFGRRTLCSCYIKWWRDQNYYDSSAWRGTFQLDGGGALMNQGIHAVDLLQWLVGMPHEISAHTATLAHRDIEVEDVATATLKFGDGSLGVIEASTAAYPGFQKRVEISGDQGSAILVDDNLTFWQFATEEPEDEKIRSASLHSSKIGGGAADPRPQDMTGHLRQIDDFVRAVRDGTQPAIPGTDARNAVRLILEIYKSARTGQRVFLD